MRTLGRIVAGVAVAASTVIVIIGLVLPVFLNPVYAGFEQERAASDRFTGYTIEEVRAVTGSVIPELFVGPGTFAQQVRGEAVFDEREAGHLRDVRAVVGIGILALVVAIGILAAAWFGSRGGSWFWRSVVAGSAVLIGAFVIVGLGFLLVFDAALETFHRLLFPPGTYTFDGRTERLVQLYPAQFWSETSVLLAIGIVVVGVVVLLGARGRLRAALGREEAAGARPSGDLAVQSRNVASGEAR